MFHRCWLMRIDFPFWTTFVLLLAQTSSQQTRSYATVSKGAAKSYDSKIKTYQIVLVSYQTPQLWLPVAGFWLPNAKRVKATTTRFVAKTKRKTRITNAGTSIILPLALLPQFFKINLTCTILRNMEQFYSENIDKYHALLIKLDSTLKPRLSTGQHGPNMVVGARIRPLLKGDGFPAAVFPRTSQRNVADIHDLYNHPSGIPILKVSIN